MADEVIAIKIIQDENSVGTAKSSAPSTGGSGNLVSGMGGMFKTVLSGLGIASIVGIVAKILSVNKGLMSVAGGIIKMVGYLLKPITDVIMILLYPILLILKPIMLMVNQIMRPFIRQAMLVMKEGASQISSGDPRGLETIAGGVSIMISGLSVVLFALLAGVIKGVIGSLVEMAGLLLVTISEILIDIFSPILSNLGVNVTDLKKTVGDTITTGTTFIKTKVNAAVDTVFGTLSAAATAEAAFTSEMFGVDAKDFGKDAVKVLKNVFADAPDNITKNWEDLVGTGIGFGMAANLTMKQTLTSGDDSISSNFGKGMDEMRRKGVTKISDAVNAFNDEFDNLKTSNGSSNRTIFQRMWDYFVERADKITLFDE